MNKLGFYTVVGVLWVGQAWAADPSTMDIITKSQDVAKVKDVTSSATLTTGDKVKNFRWWRKLLPNETSYNTLTRFDSPIEVRGQAVLFLEYDNQDNDILIYLPAYKKVRRVESQHQSASFMSSEFSYSDISNPKISDFTYKLIRKEACQERATCYVLEATPVSDTVKERTGYSHKDLWIRSDNFVQVKGEFFDLNGKMIKRMEASDIRKLNVPGKFMANEVRFTNLITGRVSVMKFSNAKANSGLDDRMFTERNISKE